MIKLSSVRVAIISVLLFGLSIPLVSAANNDVAMCIATQRIFHG